MEGVHEFFEVSDLGLLAPGPGIAHIVIPDQEIGKIGLLCFRQFFLHVGDPIQQGFDLLPDWRDAVARYLKEADL